MFSHTSRTRSRIWGTSVRKHCFLFFGSFRWFFVFCFYWFFNGSGSFLIDFIVFSMVFIGFTMVLDSFHWFLFVFHRVLLCFEWSPLVFQCFLWFPYWFWKENQRKTIGKPIPADSGASPELPSGSLSPLPALGLLLRDFPWVSPCWPPLGSSGWLCPPPSSLCLLLRVIRKKSDSGASPELPSGSLHPLSFLFHT